MRYINHKSDFQVIINIKDKEGNIVAPPSIPWEAVFADENGCEFTCCFDGTNYTHCIVDGNDIVCFVDNPGFSCGNLRCTFCQHVPSAEYCDGVMDLTQPLQCDIMLSKRESDDSTPITIEASPNWVMGPQGEQGIQGPQGIKGDQGDKGEKGEKGDKGDQGERGLQGVQGVKGDDGVSPTVTTSKTGKVTTIEITDANGVHTATVNDGESVEIVQSTGTSTTSVMSQKAVSDIVNELESQVIYDVTANNDGVTFGSLSALLSDENLSTLIPSTVRCGGMSIRFVQSSDNKYVQYRLMATSFSITESDWQGVDDEPIPNSKNLILSGSVQQYLATDNTDVKVDNPNYGIVRINGTIEESNLYRYKSLIALQPNEIFLLANGNEVYCGYNVAVLYKTDSSGNNFNLIFSFYSIKKSIVYMNTSQDVEYIGFCVSKVDDAYYRISTNVKAGSDADIQTIIGQINNINTGINTINENLDDLREECDRRWFTGEETISLSKVDYLQFDKTTNKVVSTTTIDRKVFYALISKEATYNITAINSSPIEKPVFIGTSDVVPSDGVLINNAQEINVSNVNVNIVVEEGKYLCIFINGSYTPEDSISVKGLKSLSDDISQNVSNISSNTNRIEQVEYDFGNFKITDKEIVVPYTVSSVNLEYNASTQKITTSATRERHVYYRYFEEEETVVLEGEILLNLTKTLYICKATQVPADNVPVTDVIPINTPKFRQVISVRAGEYLCLCVNESYHKNILMSVFQKIKPIILLNEKNSAPINQYDDCITDIKYCATGYGGYPGNTYGNFLACIQAGFAGLKADMRFTSDGEIVLCHDSGYTLNTNGDIIAFDSNNESNIEIHDHTYAEIMALKFANKVEGQDVHPCSLNDMLYLCKRYKSIPYLTLRNESWASDTVDRMYYLLQKYGLTTKVIINLFSANTALCTLLKNKDESILICDTKSSASLNVESIDITYNLGCQIACYRKENGSNYTDLLINQLTPDIIQYAASKNIRLWAWNTTTEQSITEHIKAGIVGFQNYSSVPVKDI